VRQHVDDAADLPDREALGKALEPRLTCAINYATRLLPPEQRTTVRTEFNDQAWRELDEQTRQGVDISTSTWKRSGHSKA
jgi:lysyl-tRNA synthetase class 1